MVSLDLFERVVNHAAALQDGADRSTSTAHLKADKRRRPAGAQRTRCGALWAGAWLVSGAAPDPLVLSVDMHVDDTAGSEMLDGEEEDECVAAAWLRCVSAADMTTNVAAGTVNGRRWTTRRRSLQ